MNQSAPTVLKVLLIILFAFPSTIEVSRAERQHSASEGIPCYAFLERGDLWTVCQGKRERIDLQGKVLDFAVSADGSYFAAQEKFELSDIGGARQLLVSLSRTPIEKSKLVEFPEVLYATCGTIISFDGLSLSPFDLINSQPTRFSLYKSFRCSSDRQVIAGWTEEYDAQTQTHARNDPGLSIQRRLRVSHSGKQSEFTIWGWEVFDVSPNGKYLAYSTVAKQGREHALCVAEAEGKPACVLHSGDSVSVSDTGEILLWVGNVGVMYWRPDLKRPLLLEKAEMNSPRPQWITPQVAHALHNWSSRRSQGAKAGIEN